MGPISTSPDAVSRALHAVWRALPDRAAADRLVATMPVPGSVALRARYHFLSDLSVPASPAERFDVPYESWQREVALIELADTALISHDTAAARGALEAVIREHAGWRHPLPVVEALVGLGDAHRQDDDFDEAADLYGRALNISEREHHVFGTVRALVPVGYLALLSGSARRAEDAFHRAAELCTFLDERLYRANALVGLGEALSRLRRPGAEAALAEATTLFASLRSDVGLANAAQHLGDLLRREGRLEEARDELLKAQQACRRSGLHIGQINAADALGEVELGCGDVSKAVDFYAEALALSQETDHLRGRAHALNGLGRCAASEGDYDVARALHHGALDAYEALGDLTSRTTALDGMARAAQAAGHPRAAVDARLRAVRAIERIRSAQDRHEDQQEYLDRFRAVYGAALRTAVDAEDGAAFVTVFESLAGRRLAGLVEALPTAATADAGLAGQMLARADAAPFAGEDFAALPDEERRARLIGRVMLRGGLPEEVRSALADVAAALYAPVADGAGERLLRRLDPGAHTLLVTPLPGDPARLAYLWAAPGGRHRVGRYEILPATANLIAALARHGLSPDACPPDVAGLAGALPAELAADLAEDDRLLVIPLGALWPVPWPAVPLPDGRFLGERCAVTVSPSLTLADHVRGRRSAPHPPRTVAHWRSPGVHHHQFLAHDADPRVLAVQLRCGADAAAAVLRDGADTVVLAGHALPVQELGHYFDLGDGAILAPTDLLTARAPRQLLLIACWGAATPGAAAEDPLTIATVALARGASAVAATVAELADDPVATVFVNDIAYRLPDMPMDAAILAATRRLLRRGDVRAGRLSRWAPLVTVGAI